MRSERMGVSVCELFDWEWGWTKEASVRRKREWET